MNAGVIHMAIFFFFTIHLSLYLSHSLFVFPAKYNIYIYTNAFCRHFHSKRFTIEEHKQFVWDELAENVFVKYSWVDWLYVIIIVCNAGGNCEFSVF